MGQGGTEGRHCARFVSQPHQNYNETTEQPSLGAWGLAKQKSYNWRHI